jgi:predicted enzyme related to lactoylglutathione lyase
LTVDITETIVMLAAGDMERAVAFWRDGVGLEVRSTSPQWSELLAGSTVVALRGGGSGSSIAQLGLRVADVDAACADIVAAGGAVRSGPEDRPDERIRLADVVDTEGNAFVVSAPLS